MYLGLAELTTAPASFGDDVAGYGAAGFAGIGLMEIKLPVDPEVGLAQLHEAGLRASLCQPEVLSVLPFPFRVGKDVDFTGPADLRERLDTIARGLRRLAPYGPAAVGIATGAVGEYEPGTARKHVVTGLREIAHVAGEAGVALALEPMHPTNPYTLIHSLTEAAEMVEEIGVPGLTIVADSHHLGDAPGLAEEIEKFGHLVSAIQISDRPAPGSGDSAYQLPGTVGTTTVDMLTAFVARGWTGPVDVELLAPRLWKQPVADAARQCFGAAARAVAMARLAAGA